MKISNAEKSKKMMDELLLQKEKWEGMEGIELFKEIKILSQIDIVKLSLLNKSHTFA